MLHSKHIIYLELITDGFLQASCFPYPSQILFSIYKCRIWAMTCCQNSIRLHSHTLNLWSNLNPLFLDLFVFISSTESDTLLFLLCTGSYFLFLLQCLLPVIVCVVPVVKMNQKAVVYDVSHSGHTHQAGVLPVHCLQFHAHLKFWGGGSLLKRCSFYWER